MLVKVLFIVAMALLAACGGRPQSSKEIPRETVLVEGMTISAKNDTYGSYRVSYVDPVTRVVEVDGYQGGFKRTLVMRVRPKRFVYEGVIGSGALGIYNPGDSRELPSGAKRVVYQENEEHFSSVEELDRFLYQGSRAYDRVCSVDGLVLALRIDEKRNSVGIDVYQLYVNGSKPTLAERPGVYAMGIEITR